MNAAQKRRSRPDGGGCGEVARAGKLARKDSTKGQRQVYGARSIKRARRTRNQVEQLDQQILDVLRGDHPQSVRHVFYRLTDPRLPQPIEKSERGYRHVQHRTAELRRGGVLPYGWITDATRQGYFVNTFANRADFVRRMAGQYRADLWQHADSRCEVWVESRSIAGVVRATCEELGVSLYPSGGFASLSFIHEAASFINGDDDGRPLTVFYIGDFDPAGVLIDQKIEEGLLEHLNPEVELRFERLGITREQIKQFELPTKPRKESDRRCLDIEFTVEAEAMPANHLRELLRSRVEELLPIGALAATKVAEESERAGLMRLADAMQRRA